MTLPDFHRLLADATTRGFTLSPDTPALPGFRDDAAALRGDWAAIGQYIPSTLHPSNSSPIILPPPAKR